MQNCFYLESLTLTSYRILLREIPKHAPSPEERYKSTFRSHKIVKISNICEMAEFSHADLHSSITGIKMINIQLIVNHNQVQQDNTNKLQNLQE